MPFYPFEPVRLRPGRVRWGTKSFRCWPAMPLSTIVLGGYLGAGKTTLLNHLLRHAQGRRIAVMVNDFGDIGIDADLIESTDGEVMNLSGGCICCSVGSDLVAALMALPQRVPPPDLVLIETSGVALPGSVARGARLAPGVRGRPRRGSGTVLPGGRRPGRRVCPCAPPGRPVPRGGGNSACAGAARPPPPPCAAGSAG